LIVKKYQAKTETEAMLKIKKELGREALIINIKSIKPRGFIRFFKKPSVEVTAAIEGIATKQDQQVDPFKNLINKTLEGGYLCSRMINRMLTVYLEVTIDSSVIFIMNLEITVYVDSQYRICSII